MRLLLDIGNSFTKWALVEPHALNFNAPSDMGQGKYPSNDFEVTSLLNEVKSVEISAVAISSVGDTDTLDLVCSTLEESLHCPIYVASVESQVVGLTNAYTDLDRLGVDRWVAAVGAIATQTTNAKIIVDAGTAVTIDYVSSKRIYEGGVILPGYRLMHDSLINNTAGIQSEPKRVQDIIGRTTAECVNSGCTFGLMGGVKLVVETMLQQKQQSADVLVCGGGGNDLLDVLSTVDASNLDNIAYSPYLIYDGLIALSTNRA